MKVTVAAGWCICPQCGNRTKTKVNANTVLINFPLYCGRCKQEFTIDYNIQT